jgi:hypothetical protein
MNERIRTKFKGALTAAAIANLHMGSRSHASQRPGERFITPSEASKAAASQPSSGRDSETHSQLTVHGNLCAEAGGVLEDHENDSLAFQDFHVIPH